MNSKSINLVENGWIDQYLVCCFYLLLLFILLFSPNIHADDSSTTISNYRSYSARFASSGQPTIDDFKRLKDSGVGRVIYLAFNNNKSAIVDEDRVITELGMEYIHIPIDFNAPKLSQYNTFASIMKSDNKKTLLHCQVNYRASTFSFLYRVIELNTPIEQAKADLDSVWELNPVWFNFMKSVLIHYSKDYQCEKCDWGANDFTN